ncbi:MAG TPA: hypothetical protein VK249_01125, partial [Anaerolineales bacterium]|nr:hypothetical protein [Anaerolineales bacterium]
MMLQILIISLQISLISLPQRFQRSCQRHRPLHRRSARKKTILILDEVITGFRVAPGGSQGHYEITPDMT